MNSSTGGTYFRRQRALHSLVHQLEVTNTKPLRVNGKTTKEQVPLTETDVKRINREIEILNKKLVS